MAEQYPTYRAGQTATAALLTSAQARVVRKLADTNRTVDTNSDDPELQMSVESNGVYKMTGSLFAISGADDDNINIAFSVPTGSDGSWSAVGLAVGATPDDTDDARIAGYAFNGGSTERGVPSQSASNPSVIHMDGILIVGSTAGTVALSWAVGTTPASTTLQTDSFFELKRIA